MVPTFEEIVLELNGLKNVNVLATEEVEVWRVYKDEMFQFTVNKLEPSDEFLEFYVRECSLVYIN